MSKNSAQAYSSWQDKDERDRILLEQLPQVRYLARRIHERLPRHVPLEDLVHAGVIGLIDALNKFDRSKHVQFGSYAKFRIRGAIIDSLREMDWGPRDWSRPAAQASPQGRPNHQESCAWHSGYRRSRHLDRRPEGLAGNPADSSRRPPSSNLDRAAHAGWLHRCFCQKIEQSLCTLHL
jgi:RNA polymerase sigma factor (sigma-70 family)